MSRHKPTRFVIALGLMVSPCLTPLPQHGLAGSGSLIQLPHPGTKIRNGILAEVDSRWIDGWGYRPVKVTLRTQKARADRTIRVVIMPNSYSKHQIPYAITSRIEIPQGSNSVSKTIYVPQQEQWHQLRIEFFDGRRKLKDLSMENSMGWNLPYWRGDDGMPTMLMVDGDAPQIADRAAFISRLQADRRKGSGSTFKLPDARKFGFMIQNYQRNMTYDHDVGRVSDLESLELLEKAPTLEIIPPSQIPNQPIGLSGIDLILIPWEDLQKLARRDAERFTALKRHIQSGGNLIVYGNQQLILDQTASIMGMRGGGWREPDQDTYQRASYQWQEAMDEDGQLYRSRRNRPATDFSQLPFFRVGQLGMGQVTAIRSEDPFKSDVAYWQWVLRTIGKDRLAWMKRHGVSLIQNNSDYWDFMIPGFGAAPVKSFLATISLFIIVIGPVNYYLLKRAKRLYLLPVTVGGAALVTTVVMLCYAVVVEGIYTRVRLRSFTQLDQVENVAATHCRHAYLASIAPSDGLSFPTRTCVYPLVAFQGHKRRREVQNDRVEVRQLVSGYIRSRSTTQFLTTEVQETEAGLAIDQTQGELKATNRLGTAVTHLWIWDDQGQLYCAHDTAHGAEFELNPVDVAGARKELKQLLLDHRPQPPPGLDKGIDRNMFGTLGYRAPRSSIPVKFGTGLLERSIAATTECFTQPVPNSYLAIATQRPPFISVGTAAQEEASMHIIRGVWEKP